MTTDASTNITSNDQPTPTTHNHDKNDAHEGVHLVVLHHGLWGNKGHVKFIAEQFKKRFGDRILVYRSESNESHLTYDGIDICAQRAVQEIQEVVRVIEAGGNIEDLKGQKNHKDKGDKGNKRKCESVSDKQKKKKKQKQKDGSKASSAASSPAASSLDSSPNSSRFSSRNNSDQDVHSTLLQDSNNNDDGSNKPKKRVTQFSFLGYSLGGLIGRFVVGLLDQEGFFNSVDQGGRGIEPMYFVTMATPHLGIRKPSDSTWSKTFNFLSSRMLSRTGEQLQFVDDYVQGKPLLLVMSEPEGVFAKALARFKRRALYCNIRNDRSVPFWTASFSDADPFSELETMEIQYDSGYSSLIESFEHLDVETLTRLRKERAESLKSTTFAQRTAHKLTNLPWKRYAFIGLLGPILIPVWIVIASTTISYQGLKSRRRTKNWADSSKSLQQIREKASTTTLDQYKDDDDDGDNNNDDMIEGQAALSPSSTSSSKLSTTEQDELNESNQKHTVVSIKCDGSGETEETVETVSHSYPELKTVRPLPLQAVQVEISRNLNKLEWQKNIIHIEAWNAHASIVVREKRFMHDGGAAAVQHAVDMFKDDGEDE
ncbi:hypothetical protein BGX34_011718 [Mortierella sp. NVP85]|nr:hypothetical protein BGX34_011718 [Mortierella sp. NVP85]